MVRVEAAQTASTCAIAARAWPATTAGERRVDVAVDNDQGRVEVGEGASRATMILAVWLLWLRADAQTRSGQQVESRKRHLDIRVVGNWPVWTMTCGTDRAVSARMTGAAFVEARRAPPRRRYGLRHGPLPIGPAVDALRRGLAQYPQTGRARHRPLSRPTARPRPSATRSPIRPAIEVLDRIDAPRRPDDRRLAERRRLVGRTFLALADRAFVPR
jgi:hypothetical protein